MLFRSKAFARVVDRLLASPRFLDNVIMVVESGQTRRDELQEGLEALKQSRSKLAGAVLAA